VSQLRKLLGKERLLTQPHGYLLRVEPDELDLARFKRLRAEGKLHDALAMWRGPPLADFAHQRFAQSEIALLEELLVTCLEERLDADLTEARHAELVGSWRRSCRSTRCASASASSASSARRGCSFSAPAVTSTPFRDSHWPSTLAAVAREPVTTRLSLRGLSERDVAEYLQLAAGEFASSELIAALHEETEGNPLFVGETVRLLALEGRIAIPESVKDVISRRLAHLGDECNRVLVLASVLGREFALDDLARLSAVDEAELLDTLDEAMAARVVSDVPGVPTHVRFAHVLIRDTLYEGLTAARRARLQRQTVEALESLHGDDGGLHLAELAHHCMAGNDFDKALRYAERGGDQALVLHAYEEAARLFALGLEAHDLGEGEPGKRCDLLLALGHAQVRAGDGAGAKQTFFEAAAVARRLERPDALARAALGYGGRFVWARAAGDDRLVALLREVLAADVHDAALRARLLARLATALRDEPELEPRALLSNEAVEDRARTRRSRDARVHAGRVLCSRLVAGQRGRTAGHLDRARRPRRKHRRQGARGRGTRLSLPRTARARRGRGRRHRFRGACQAHKGDAPAPSAGGASLARFDSEPAGRCLRGCGGDDPSGLRARTARTGRRGARHVRAAALVLRRAAEITIGAVSRQLGALAAAMSEFDAAERHFEHALGLNARMGARPWLGHTQHDFARILLARGGPGDRERAEQLPDQALATFSRAGYAEVRDEGRDARGLSQE
jgi:tetratricopeptide (TPR) repeat protein